MNNVTLTSSERLRLENGSKAAVMGGGPAGSLFAYFLLDMAQRDDLNLQVDIYEPRDFSLVGPPGCNMCAGIISESLVQLLAMEGINLPPNVVQRGIDTYVLHTEVGKTFLETPHLEKRIGVVFRGAGPLGMVASEWSSFDGFLLDQALHKGATLRPFRVEAVELVDGRPQLRTRLGQSQSYDLLAVATGVNTNALRMFPPVQSSYRSPKMVQTFIREYLVGKEHIEHHMGHHTLHFFLLDIPGLDFAAIVPKGNYVTVCLLGAGINKETFDRFLHTSQVRACMPPAWQPDSFACHCAPRINLSGAVHPYADRMVFLGDSGVSRLYKDGIGAAYRAAKYAATAAIFHGVGEADLRRHFWRPYQRIEYDNHFGKLIFTVVQRVKPLQFVMRSVTHMVTSEQSEQADKRHMSKILWDIFTGSAPYRDIFLRLFYPQFWSRFLWMIASSLEWRP